MVSLNALTEFNAGETDETSVILVTITHDDWVVPVRLSSDPTKKLSDDPLRFGTVSKNQTYEFVLITPQTPDDQEGAPTSGSLVFENVDADMTKLLRSISTPATIDIVVVLASTPDIIEAEWRGLSAVRGSYDLNQVTVDISRDPVTSEPWPAHRMTQSRFPGLYR